MPNTRPVAQKITKYEIISAVYFGRFRTWIPFAACRYVEQRRRPMVALKLRESAHWPFELAVFEFAVVDEAQDPCR